MPLTVLEMLQPYLNEDEAPKDDAAQEILAAIVERILWAQQVFPGAHELPSWEDITLVQLLGTNSVEQVIWPNCAD